MRSKSWSVMTPNPTALLSIYEFFLLFSHIAGNKANSSKQHIKNSLF